MKPANPHHSSPAPLRDVSPFDGVLLVDKPAGPTSHDIVDAIRRSFGLKKVGHGGTLDPSATGLLILLLGKATKLSSRFIGSDKTYEGTLCLGVTTNTQDADGDVESQRPYEEVTRESLESAMQALTGDMFQTPPMVSAVKVNGVPLYKHARKGREVERKPRLIHVYEFSLLTFAPPLAAFRVRCTKGTYVRTLCADIGEALGCGAHLSSLRRTQSGALSVEQALPWDTLAGMSKDELKRHVLPLQQFAVRPA
jgi:tRNA pseudouridine55 synthase